MVIAEHLDGYISGFRHRAVEKILTVSMPTLLLGPTDKHFK
jgi:hypothetical protein